MRASSMLMFLRRRSDALLIEPFNCGRCKTKKMTKKKGEANEEETVWDEASDKVKEITDETNDQSSIKCCSAAALLRAEQGPCEPSEDVVHKFGEQ